MNNHDLALELSQLGQVAFESRVEIKVLNAQLYKSKLFLNMVIHDMRNPTVSIKFGLEMAISELQQIKLFHVNQTVFQKKCESLQE